jgi:hypothetical protein
MKKRAKNEEKLGKISHCFSFVKGLAVIKKGENNLCLTFLKLARIF